MAGYRRKGVVWTAGAALIVLASGLAKGEEDRVARGAYLTRAGGCISCHTDVKHGGAAFAGGRALKTPFGTFYSPNLTPDRETGIGRWSDTEFLDALRRGIAPDGAHYFPVFPYPSYARMTAADALAIKAYLFSVPPVAKANRSHDVGFPFAWRFLQTFWKLLYFDDAEFTPDAARSAQWNRGAYLATALAHCGECHTPRNFLGAPDTARAYAGTADGPDGGLVANITPDLETGLGDWSVSDIVQLLKTGIKPDFDDVQGSMAEVIDDSLKHLSDDDLKAIAVYVKSLAAVRHKVERRRK